MLKNNRGFTLIELLIVIVIIGVLAGVLVAVINPAQQESRARDAGVQATINKAALAAEGFVSAYGRAPTGDEFFALLNNTTATSCDGAGPHTNSCNFLITGNVLDSTCDATAGGWHDNSAATTGSDNCFYHYYTDDPVNGTHFRIAAKSFGVAHSVFMYDNTTGAIDTQCKEDVAADGAGSGCNGT